MTSQRRWMLGSVWLVMFLTLLDGFAVAVALDAIRAGLHGSTAGLAWTMNAFLLAAAAVLPAGAVLEARFGRRLLAAAGSGLLAAASVACALAPGIGWLVAARALQGAGAALAVCAVSARILSDCSPHGRERGRPLWSFAVGLAAAFVAAPAVGALVVAGPGWRWLFALNVVAVPAAWVPGSEPVRESAGRAGRLDLERPLLLVVGAVAAGTGLAFGSRDGWVSAGAVVALAIGAVAFGVFLKWSVPLGARHAREYVTTRTVDFCLYASLIGTMFLLAQFFSVRDGDGLRGAGVRLLPWTAAIAVASLVLIRRGLGTGTGSRFGTGFGTDSDSGAGYTTGFTTGFGSGGRGLVAAGLAMNSFGLGWLMIAARTPAPYRWLLPALIVSGSGIGVSLSAAWTVGSHGADRRRIGEPAAVLTVPRLVGGIFGVMLLAAVFSGRGDFSSSHRFAAALGADAVLALVGAAVGLARAADRTAR